ncbi:sulfite reductase subunit alpha [Stutzerimonas zhaodongensis]|uniref:sulfite reductase subunit alpha n=1 Tax=Stutzerimonas zhaodongensis TaxID=1176257 RepID=UPI001FC9F409|nr:sulfite reductase subunit alpha [Stutzerimonas zhaodongensis]MCQ4318392.1 sulfite reductase subunit alpha [Stutzerimonas zhaodongensis]
MVRTTSLLRYVPLVACLLLATLLLWWHPSRVVSAVLVAVAYLAVCGHFLRRSLARAQRTPGADGNALLIGYASQGDTARTLAERSAQQLREAGVAVDMQPLNGLDFTILGQPRRALFILSTYGEGEAPDNAARFERALLNTPLDLSSLEYAVLALGDQHYRHFCGFGRRIDTRLRSLGAQPLFDRLEADRADPGTLRHWQQQLGHISGRSDFIDWQPAAYQPWKLARRALLNPGSQGAPVYQLAMLPPDTAQHWQAGDIAEVGPRNALVDVERLLRRLGFDPSQPVEGGESLATALLNRRLPQDADGADLATLLALPRLPHREYSIASIPAEGHVALIVREARHPDGRLGVGSGWLCRHAAIGSTIDLRIRSNPGFHGLDLTRPMILIGNGTGIAGLRAHLRERAAMTASRNWLLYGERNAAHDQLLRQELEAWAQTGHLERIDLAFSRDQQAKVYVQHLLRDAAEDVRRWVTAGACIYLCGSLEGMGREVQQILAGVLGEDQLQQLEDEGRYRRDLY